MNTDKKLIEERDKLTPSPEQRATYIYQRIGKVRPWDLICFCAESLALMAAEYEFLKPAARYIIQVVYTAHYHTPEVYPSSCPIPLPSSKPVSLTEAALPQIELTIKDEIDLL